VKIDNGSDVINMISHRVYQTGEGERESDRPRTSENQAIADREWAVIFPNYWEAGKKEGLQIM